VRRVSSSHLQKVLPALLLIAGSVLPAPGRGADLPPLRSMGAPFFSADLAVTIDSLTHPSVVVTITVPFAELNWTKTPGGYAAAVGFAVDLQPSRRDRLYGGSWEKRVLLESYEATRNSRNNVVAARTFDVPPGRYHVRVHVRDVSSEQESMAEEQFVLDDLAKTPVGFADLQLGILDSLGGFVAVPARTFGYDSDRLAARVTAFDRRPGEWPRPAVLHYRVLDGEGTVQAQGDTIPQLTQTTQTIVLRPHVTELFIGDYTLEVERVEGKSRWRSSRAFEVEESGPPRGRAFELMLEAMSYVAQSEEIEGMRKLTADQQSVAWERFWRRRDPTPETARNEYQVEFFRRFHYASQHFQGFGFGWRSDMGRIYIRYGPPDQVEQHPATASTPQAEVWYYNQPSRRFVFADREGFGRFTLVQPALE
jgi:GWxTD domain-containing protein